MTQIVFLTLFLGLTLGPQPVAVEVTGPVASVELILDGYSLETLESAPWKGEIDFGSQLLPHRLVARALDADGNELARVEQRVNVPHPLAEAGLIVESRSARLIWQSLDTEKPKDVQWILDGKRLEADSIRAPLPALDPDKPHLLRAIATSKSGGVAEAEVVFGGGMTGVAASALTAVPVRVENDADSVSNMASAITVNGEPAQVVAVEQVTSDIIFVRDPTLNDFARIDPESRAHRRSGFGSVDMGRPRLEKNQGIRFFWPVAIRARGTAPADLFAASRTFFIADADAVRSVLTNISAPSSERLRFADAIAVAGLQAAASHRPRAVVLIVGSQYKDASQLTPQQTKEYLAAIGIPLYIWTTTAATATEWGEARRIDGSDRVRDAAADLLNDVRRQRIVWIAGDHMLSEIEVKGERVKPLWSGGLSARRQ
jgi:hypothetical protein